MSGTPIWTTKDKERIPITKMSDSHVRNTRRMMYAKAQLYYDVIGSGGGVILKDSFYSAFSWCQVLQAECEERGLPDCQGLQLDSSYEPDPVLYVPIWNEVGPLSEIVDADIISLEYDLRSAGIAVLGMLGADPHGDAAQDAFDQEFHYANRMLALASRWLPVMRSESSRRGLELREN